MLKMDDDSATAVYHAFNMLCYFSPLFGAMLADSLLGKYKWVILLSYKTSYHKNNTFEDDELWLLLQTLSDH